MAKKSKILFLSTHEETGGAGKAAKRIFDSLSSLDIYDLEFLTLKSCLNEMNLFELIKFKTQLYFEKITRKTFKKTIETEVFSTSFTGATSQAFNLKINSVDSIVLFWVNQNFLSLDMIGEILNLNKPVIWRLSDMWPFTGGCHYSFGCYNYKTACHDCPALSGPFEVAKVTLEKKLSWKLHDLTIFSPSQWILDQANQSRIFQEAQHILAPTGVDLSVFRPDISSQWRKSIMIDSHKLLIGVSASNLNDYRKGLDLFLESMQKTPDSCLKLIHVIFIGSISSPPIMNFSYTITGHVNDDEVLADIYSGLDIFVAPSREENLANTVLENLACGTPCVAFNIGGMKDVIVDNENGFLIQPYRTDDLTKMIVMLSGDRTRIGDMGKNAAKFIRSKNSIEKSVEPFVKFFQEKLG